MTTNSQFVTWNYEKVVTRNCGAGAEEIYRQPTAVVGTSAALVDYNTSGTENLSTGGYVDSIRVHLANPDSNLVIYLSPFAVESNYPTWPGDTSDLRFISGSPGTMEGAMESVIAHALARYATATSLPMPNNDQFCEVTAGGSVKIRFRVTHDPTGHYAAIDHVASDRFFHFHQTASTTVASTRAAIVGISAVAPATYAIPCGTTIVTTYFDASQVVITTGNSNWRTLVPESPTTTSLSGSLGTGTCLEDCNGSECLSICELPEVVIQDAPWNGCNSIAIGQDFNGHQVLFNLNGGNAQSTIKQTSTGQMVLYALNQTFNLGFGANGL